MDSTPWIAASAHRHGVDKGDMLHALRNAFRQFDVDEGMTMVIGADQAGRLLEVGIVRAAGPRDTEVVVVHAMPPRRKFLVR